jgi:hypothetical protein
LLVGTTTANGFFGTTEGSQLSANYVGASRSGGPSLYVNRYTSTGTIVDIRYAGATVGTISTDGTNTAYNQSSDRRLKENIAPADDAGSVIDAIQIVKHDWKVGGHTRFGVIAQDLYEVAPEAVAVGDPENVETLENPWGVDYSKLVPMLVKEIQSLRARVAQLESK